MVYLQVRPVLCPLACIEALGKRVASLTLASEGGISRYGLSHYVRGPCMVIQPVGIAKREVRGRS